MRTQWAVNTKGDPLGAVAHVVQEVWRGAGLDAMLVPPKSPGQVRVLESPAGLEEVNPFQPLMLMNAAKVLPQVLMKRKSAVLGAMLRPCELRALGEMVKRHGLDATRLLTICVDCLGTFPEDEFAWRSARKGSDAGLTREALQFAPQGGIAAYRYRAACQMCTNPGATEADVNIGVLGLPVRQTILVEVKNGRMDWKAITDGAAAPAMGARRAQTLAKLAERNTRTRERVVRGLSEVLPADLEALLDQFEACGACQSCMDNCPICAIAYPRRDKRGRYERADVAAWLASCAGCGMCEQSCPKHLPLSIIFTHVKAQLEGALAV